MTPLPPRLILAQLPDMNAWRIVFTFDRGPSGTGKPAPMIVGLLQQLTVTMTKPLWHSELETIDSQKFECWRGGTADTCFIIQGAEKTPEPVSRQNVSSRPSGEFFTGDFPD